MTKTVWDRLAEMTPEKREVYLKTAPNKAKVMQTGVKGVVYKSLEILPAKDGLVWGGGPGWDVD